MSRYANNPKYYVCKLSSSSVHTARVVKKMRGFNDLKKGDPFDFSTTAFWDAEGQGRIWQATSDYNKKGEYIEAEETYNPEI